MIQFLYSFSQRQIIYHKKILAESLTNENTLSEKLMSKSIPAKRLIINPVQYTA